MIFVFECSSSNSPFSFLVTIREERYIDSSDLFYVTRNQLSMEVTGPSEVSVHTSL
jgi:hypothetical protein